MRGLEKLQLFLNHPQADAKIAEVAKNATGRFVTLDEQRRAEWVPMSDSVLLEEQSLAGAVIRRTPSLTEVLVLHTGNDISEKEIAALERFTDHASRDLIRVTLTDAGARRFFPFTVDHLGRAVAVIADGEVRTAPRIVAPVAKTIVLSPKAIDKVRVVSSNRPR